MSEKTAPDETGPLLLPRQDGAAASGERRSRLSFLTTILAQLAALSLLANFWWDWTHPGATSVVVDADGADKWSWSDVKPSRDLEWQPCYDDVFECARLDVPMDWQDLSDGQRVVLGVMKLPAKTKSAVSVPPLLMNPGGPGGSGVATLRAIGHHIQTIAGDYHDVISWDPRGVGISTPRADCWSNTQKRLLWLLQETPIVDERPGLVYDAYSRAAAFSGVCEEALRSTGLLRHLSTASAARDMLEIVHRAGHDKLRYWGFSYGTLLGGVFASMYPDKVDRLVSDGNVDYVDWFQGDRSHFVQDADSILDTFDAACHAAGPERCALWVDDGGAAGVGRRRARILESLKTSPVLIPAGATPSGPRLPVVVTYSFLQALTRMLLYKPLVHAPGMAAIYAGLERGDGLPYYRMVLYMTGRRRGDDDNGPEGSDDDDASDLLCPLSDTPVTEPLETLMEPDAFPAIMCSDGVPVTDTPAEFADYLDRMLGLSRWAGAACINFRVVCVGRTERPDWRFAIGAGDEAVVTAQPILFVNNLQDNVTPLQSAHNNSAHFPGSVVLQQNSLGHCSLAAPSSCTARHIQRYFLDGSLPPVGTQCEQDYGLFETPPGQNGSAATLDAVARASWEMSRRGDVWFGRVAWQDMDGGLNE